MTQCLIFNRYRENIADLMDKCFPEKNKPGRKRFLKYNRDFVFWKNKGMLSMEYPLCIIVVLGSALSKKALAFPNVGCYTNT